MNAWVTTLLLAAVLVPLFLALNHFGLLVAKSCGCVYGAVMGTRTRFWGEYRDMRGSVSKNFWINGKYSTLSIRMEPASGSAGIEVLDENKNVLHSWNACWPLDREVSCHGLKKCRVRITSQDFSGKFDIFLQ